MNMYKKNILALLAFASFLMVLGTGTGNAAPCTPGTDCYCDKVKNPSSPLYDANLLFCEDFEAPTLYNNQGVGNGAPYYGPWYDDTGMPGNRGNNSYWNKKYGNGVSSMLFASGQPAAPSSGKSCTYALCTGAKVWDPSDLWSANSYSPLVAFFSQASNFTAENSALTVPTNAAGGRVGIFDGNASLAYRIPAGATHGIVGEATFPKTYTIGYTAALAYPINSDSSGIWGTSATPGAWKHNEWATVNSPNCGFDGLFSFYNQLGPRNGRPFAGFIGAFGSGCSGGGYSGSITNVAAGSASLISGGLGVYWNTPTNYNQPTDWPYGTWGCVRGYLTISGGSQHYQVWFQGPNMTSERLIIDITYTTGTLDNAGGYNGMKWNAYANTNQGMGYVASTALTFRYEDNVHARAGLPVSCSQIGFSGTTSADITPPSAPVGLKIM